MTDDAINDLLASIIAMYAPTAGGRIAVRKVSQKMANTSVKKTIPVAVGDPYAQAKTTFGRCGTVLEQDDTNQTLSGVILSGVAGMNPAFVVVCCEGGAIHVTATAKESLIKQHTA